jgi:hypothetical protein
MYGQERISITIEGHRYSGRIAISDGSHPYGGPHDWRATLYVGDAMGEESAGWLTVEEVERVVVGWLRPFLTENLSENE